MSIELLHKLLMVIAEKGINDLHLSVGALPAVRKNGEVHFLSQLTPITMADMDSIMKQVLKPEMLDELNQILSLARGVIA
jgi:Tfp pilus assembly pilus retraction ATPase PilT